MAKTKTKMKPKKKPDHLTYPQMVEILRQAHFVVSEAHHPNVAGKVVLGTCSGLARMMDDLETILNRAKGGASECVRTESQERTDSNA